MRRGKGEPTRPSGEKPGAKPYNKTYNKCSETYETYDNLYIVMRD